MINELKRWIRALKVRSLNGNLRVSRLSNSLKWLKWLRRCLRSNRATSISRNRTMITVWSPHRMGTMANNDPTMTVMRLENWMMTTRRGRSQIVKKRLQVCNGPLGNDLAKQLSDEQFTADRLAALSLETIYIEQFASNYPRRTIDTADCSVFT